MKSSANCGGESKPPGIQLLVTKLNLTNSGFNWVRCLHLDARATHRSGAPRAAVMQHAMTFQGPAATYVDRRIAGPGVRQYSQPSFVPEQGPSRPRDAAQSGACLHRTEASSERDRPRAGRPDQIDPY